MVTLKNKQRLVRGWVILFLILPGCFEVASHKSQLLVINVLEKSFYDDCHIQGSINVPFDQVEQAVKEWDKTTQIVFYCSNYYCTASGAAARMLQNMGFENVFVYDAGMAEWYQNNLPIQGACTQAYLNKKIEQPEEREQGVKLLTTPELQAKIEKYKAA